MTKHKAILVAVDGSQSSDRAMRYALDQLAEGRGPELHLLNVQPDLGGGVSAFISKEAIDNYHRDEGDKGLASALDLAKRASVAPTVHIGVGRHGVIVNDFANKVDAGLVVIGTRGHTGLAGVLLGSVAQDILAHVTVPVTLVK